MIGLRIGYVLGWDEANGDLLLGAWTHVWNPRGACDLFWLKSWTRGWAPVRKAYPFLCPLNEIQEMLVSDGCTRVDKRGQFQNTGDGYEENNK